MKTLKTQNNFVDRYFDNNKLYGIAAYLPNELDVVLNGVIGLTCADDACINSDLTLVSPCLYSPASADLLVVDIFIKFGILLTLESISMSTILSLKGMNKT
jgi:hypothetical protein